MPDTPVRAIVFDVGHTLWFMARSLDWTHILPQQGARLRPLVASWGITLDEPVEQVQREIWDAVEEAYRAEEERGTRRDPSVPFLIRGALAVRGVDVTEAQAEAWFRAAYLSVSEFGWQLYPDTLDVLRELHGRGLRIGVATNRPFPAEMFRESLAEYGMAPYIDVVVCSADAGHFKQHPAVFELVLRELGSAPGETVMVGDDAEADMRGGKAAGMRTVWKLNGRYELPPCRYADYTIHDLGELLSLPLFSSGRPAAESLTPHDDANADRY
ncbi:MAG: HAD family hydrolase [Dehalococcoidia bacterium]